MDGSNQIAEYAYNGAGQRIKKVTQTEAKIFHYDLKGHLIAETNPTSQMLADYVTAYYFINQNDKVEFIFVWVS